jgi:hypothetical protein
MAKIITTTWTKRGLDGPLVPVRAFGYTLMVNGTRERKFSRDWTEADAQTALAAALNGPAESLLARYSVLAGTALQEAQSPIVYMFIARGQVKYIGASAKGLGRPFGPHHRLRGIACSEGDVLLYFPAPSWGEAQQIERTLIAAIRPEWNKSGGLRRATLRHQAVTPRRARRTHGCGHSAVAQRVAWG